MSDNRRLIGGLTLDLLINTSDDLEKFPDNKASKFVVDIDSPVILTRPMQCSVDFFILPKQWIRFASATLRWKSLGDSQWRAIIKPLRSKNIWEPLAASTAIQEEVKNASAPCRLASTATSQHTTLTL